MSALLLCVSHFSTKFAGIDRTINLFRWLGQTFKPRRASPATAEQIAEKTVRGMQMLPLRIECLDQAIATWFALNRHQHPATLKIGMRLAPLSGHAWVACNEQIFGSIPGIEDFTIVAFYPPWSEAA